MVGLRLCIKVGGLRRYDYASDDSDESDYSSGKVALFAASSSIRKNNNNNINNSWLFQCGTLLPDQRFQQDNQTPKVARGFFSLIIIILTCQLFKYFPFFFKSI